MLNKTLGTVGIGTLMTTMSRSMLSTANGLTLGGVALTCYHLADLSRKNESIVLYGGTLLILIVFAVSRSVFDTHKKQE